MKDFIDDTKIETLLKEAAQPDRERVEEIIAKALELKGLSPEEKSLINFIQSGLSQKISVKIGKDRVSGSLTLHYGSEEEFQDLMVRLTGQKYTP